LKQTALRAREFIALKIPEIERAIMAGQLKSVADAGLLARYPHKTQRKVLADVLEGRVKSIKAAQGRMVPSRYDRLGKARNA
jgi:hypothetical protein